MTMATQGMNPKQVCAYWLWYKSAFSGDGRRSLRAAAEALHVSPATVAEWHRDFAWDHLAADQDRKIGRRIESEVTKEIVRDFRGAVERQQRIIHLLFRRFAELIPDLCAGDFGIANVIRLMEFETNYVFNEDRGKTAGNFLAVVLQMMPAEDRVRFNAAIERARDAGLVRFDPVGPPGRN